MSAESHALAVGDARGWFGTLRTAASCWSKDNASTIGAALAFNCAFSLAPLLVILLVSAGAIVGQEAAYSGIGHQLTGLFGPSTAKTLLSAMKTSQHPAGMIATCISVVTLLIGATSVLAALETALETIWRMDLSQRSGLRGWVRTRFVSLGFILTLGFLLLISLTLSTGISALRTRYAVRHTIMISTVGAADTLMSLALVALLFALIFRYMPPRRLPWRVVALGGLMTAIMFDIGRWGVGLYLAHSTQPSAFGAAASFATLLLWLYYTAQIFLFGAEFTATLGGLKDEHQPTPPINRGTTLRQQ